jgi:competence protein ComEC
VSPAIALFAPAAAGALLTFAFDLSALWAVCAAALCAGLALAVRAPTLRAPLVLFVAAATAAFTASLQRDAHAAVAQALPHGRELVVEGVVDDRAAVRGGGARLTLDVDGGDALPPGTRLDVWLAPALAGASADAGDRVRVWGRLRRFAPALSPGRFDAARWGFARGVHGTLSPRFVDDVERVTARATPAPFARARASLRARVLSLLTPREAGVVLALIIGDTSLFDDEQLALYRRVGAGHLLAVSGLQVTLLAVVLHRLLLWLALALRPALVRDGRAGRLAAALAAVAVWCFVGLCGAPPSAVRAAGMATAVLGSLALGGRRVRALDALGACGLVTVLVSPRAVVAPGFLLSYAAVIGLLLAARSVDDEWPLARLRAAAAATLGAGALTLPVAAHLFGEVAPGGLLANLVLVPAASLLQIPAIGFGLAAAALSSTGLAQLAAGCAGLIEALCGALDGPLGGLVPVSAPAGLSAAALTVGVAALVVGGLGRAGPRTAALGVAIVGATLSLGLVTPGGVRVTVLPVGQGDAAVFELPSGDVVLVDGGGVWDERTDPGADIVLPWLQRRGVDELAAVVLSHPDPDHLLGLLPVVDALPVRELWHPGYDEEHPLMARLLARCRARGVEVRGARELLGRHRFGDVEVEVLAPAPKDGSALYDELSPNENSLAFVLRFGDDAALWAGDLEEWGEHFLLAGGRPLDVDLVKAPHHGSRTSSTPAFVRATRPAHVVFGVGRDNRFGFPHAEVSARWRAAGARLWRTDTHGEVTFWLTGRGVRARPYRGAGQGQAN